MLDRETVAALDPTDLFNLGCHEARRACLVSRPGVVARSRQLLRVSSGRAQITLTQGDGGKDGNGDRPGQRWHIGLRCTHRGLSRGRSVLEPATRQGDPGEQGVSSAFRPRACACRLKKM